MLFLVPKIDRHAYFALEEMRNRDISPLTLDEAAAINLYTREWRDGSHFIFVSLYIYIYSFILFILLKLCIFFKVDLKIMFYLISIIILYLSC